MADLPYFPFYPADWVSSPRIMCLTLAQQGAYIRLLCALWMSKDCSLPDDSSKLSMITGLPVDEVPCLGPFIGPCKGKSGFITNDRLMKEWEKAHWISDARAKAGRKSGKVRRTHVQHKHIQTVEQSVNISRNDVHKSEVIIQSQKSELRNQSKKLSADADALARFEEFWKIYPARNGRKVEKAHSMNHFLRLTVHDQSLAVQAAKHYADALKIQGLSAKDPKRFLMDGRGQEPWRDYIARTQDVPGGACQERVRRENFLKPCGAPSVEVMNGRPLCKEHYEQRRNHTASA